MYCSLYLKALKSFERALHVNPASSELWSEDLSWARSLLRRKAALQRESDSNLRGNSSDQTQSVGPSSNSQSGALDTHLLHFEAPVKQEMRTDRVFMRD